MELTELNAKEALEKIDKKDISPADLTEAYLNRIDEVDGRVGAYLHLDPSFAMDQARRAGQSGEYPLPIAIKDNISLKGAPVTCASKILDGYRPVFDAHIIEKLNESGAVYLGKTNLDEFAMGSSTENSAFKITANPWGLDRVPGGSSGGSAAAVAADEAIWALGSDTGGSIRQPAAFCGIVGLKPTYGLVSRYGLVAFASSLDQIGPMTKTVTDNALLLKIIAGHDCRDSTSLDHEIPDYAKFIGADISGLRVGLPVELFGEGIDSEVQDIVKSALAKLEALGAVIEETSLKSFDYALSAYYLIAPAEASSNLARFDGVRYGYRSGNNEDIIEMYKNSRSQGFGAEVKRRIMLGTYSLSAGYYDAYYGQAQKVRTIIKNEFERAFSHFDLLISPTTPTTAFKIGEKSDDPMTMYLSDICTIPANLAGIPAMSIPCGLAGGLPVGLQLMAKHFNEPTMFKAAYAMEQEIGFKLQPALK